MLRIDLFLLVVQDRQPGFCFSKAIFELDPRARAEDARDTAVLASPCRLLIQTAQPIACPTMTATSPIGSFASVNLSIHTHHMLITGSCSDYYMW